MKKLLLVFLLVASPLAAQEPVPSVDVPVDKTFSIVWDHDKVNTVGYRVYVDGAYQGETTPSMSTPTGISITVNPGLLVQGVTVLVELSAYNTIGESPRSGIRITGAAPEATVAPSSPTNPRVIIQ